jgi:hypothetical protein
MTGATISDGRRPGHRQRAVALHGEFKLQSLALVVGIDRIGGDGGPFLFAPFLRFFRGLVVKQPITLDHVKSQVLGDYRTAIGDTVEPLAPCSFSGCTMKANS